MDTILFACVQNAGRSQMAAGFFNALADPARARAVSAGTRPAARVHETVVEVMRDRGVDLSHVSPQRLTNDVTEGVQWLITMGCGEECPFLAGVRREDWALPDPAGQSVAQVREIRDVIERQVRTFVEREGWGRTS